MSQNPWMKAIKSVKTDEIQEEDLLLSLSYIRGHLDAEYYNSNLQLISSDKISVSKFVEYSTHSNGRISQLCLSILGNCATDRCIARQLIFKHNLLQKIGTLFEGSPTSDALNGRIFRILGNICKHKDAEIKVMIVQSARIYKQALYILKIAQETDPKEPSPTITTIVRFIRESLCNNVINMLVERFEILKTIGMLLVKWSDGWPHIRSNIAQLKNLIIIIQEFSRYKLPSVLHQLRNTYYGDSVSCLSNILELSPQAVITTIMNLLRVSSHKSDLPVHAIFDSLCKYIETKESTWFDPDEECAEAICCICQLYMNPSNLEYASNSSLLLLRVFNQIEPNTSGKLSLSQMIATTLSRCQFSELALSNTIIVSVAIPYLLTKLKWLTNIVGDKLKLPSHSIKPKTENSIECLSWAEENNFRDDSDNDGSVADRVDWMELTVRRNYSSAEEADEEVTQERLISGWTPDEFEWGATLTMLGHTSPSHSYQLQVEENSDEDYSPITSQVDPNDINDSNRMAEVASSSSPVPDESSCESNKSQDDSEPSTPPLKKICMAYYQLGNYFPFETRNEVLEKKQVLYSYIIKILQTYLHRSTMTAQKLRSIEVVQILLQAMINMLVELGNLKYYALITQTLTLIAGIGKASSFFIPLVSSTLLQEIHKVLHNLPHSQRCTVCFHSRFLIFSVIRRLLPLAISEQGVTEIGRAMKGGDELMQCRIVTSIPLITGSQKVCANILFKLGGLKVLMSMFENYTKDSKSDVWFEHAILAICNLKHLRAFNAKELDNLMPSKAEQIELEPYSCPADKENIVTFLFQPKNLVKPLDGVTVDRNVLLPISEYFTALLAGQFREANENEIFLEGIKASTFRTLLSVLQVNRDQMKPNMMLKNVSLNAHLELIPVLDRFMMHEWHAILVSNVERFGMTVEGIPTVYRWAVQTNQDNMRQIAINYAFLKRFSYDDRMTMFRHLFQLDLNAEVLRDIKVYVQQCGTQMQGSVGIPEKANSSTASVTSSAIS